MKRPARENASAMSPGELDVPEPVAPAQTMSFSLMTKKGNKQQTRTIDLPSDSSFAVAMRTQQQADREEQQRIKNLVLNYEASNESEATEADFEKRIPASQRLEKPTGTRGAFRSRKLQLSDVNW